MKTIKLYPLLLFIFIPFLGFSQLQVESTGKIKMSAVQSALGFQLYSGNQGGSATNNYTFYGYNFDAYVTNFKVYTSVWANGVYLTSDSIKKQNITPLENSFTDLKKLQPVSYTFKPGVSNAPATLSARNAQTEQETQEENRIHYGFLAQDMVKVFPNLVARDDSTGTMAINYIELIPLLVEAYQDQQAKIEALEQEIDLLKSNELIGRISAPSLQNEPNELSINNTQQAALYQNTPNPFNQSTEIRYYLPQTISTAYLSFYDLQGKLLKQIPLTKRGDNTETLSGSEFQSGMYLYALIADGNEVDVKRMILTK